VLALQKMPPHQSHIPAPSLVEYSIYKKITKQKTKGKEKKKRKRKKTNLHNQM
jgi:hypothetical protein